LKLDAESNVDYEHHFKDTLTDQDIDDIIAYIKSQDKPVVMP